MGFLFSLHLITEQVLVNESEMKIIDVGPDLLELHLNITWVRCQTAVYSSVFVLYYLLTEESFTNSMAWLIG